MRYSLQSRAWLRLTRNRVSLATCEGGHAQEAISLAMEFITVSDGVRIASDPRTQASALNGLAGYWHHWSSRQEVG